MRVLIDIPLDANTDLDKIYQVIAQVNQSEQDKHPEVLTGPTILGPQIEKKWSLFLPLLRWLRKMAPRRRSIIPTINSTMMPWWKQGLAYRQEERDHVIRNSEIRM